MKAFRIPSLVLAAALQLLPIARFAAICQQPAAPLWAIILRWAGAAAAALGSIEAVSGASTVITNPLTDKGTNGVPLKQFRLTTAPDQAHYWTATGLPQGVNLVGTSGSTLWYFSGTPTVAGVFNVRVTAKDQINSGFDRTVSSTIVMTIVSTGTAPSITSPPASQTVVQGSSVTFSVTAAGTAPLTYQWQKNTQNIANATNSSLTLPSVTTSDAGSYTVTVANSISSATSAPATLTVTVPVVPPAVTAAPASQTVAVGSPVTFSVTATGDGPLSYQWLKDDQDINGATSPSFSIAAAALTDAGSYRVLVSNTGGNILSDPAVLTVTVPVTAPTITSPPVGLSVHAGQNAKFTTTAAGTAPLQYKWFRGANEIPGATASTLSLSAVDVSAAGDYSVEVSNSGGSAHSAPATLNVSILQILSVAENNGALTVTFNGIPGQSYQWSKKNSLSDVWQVVSPAIVTPSNGTMSASIANTNGEFFRLGAAQ